MTLLDFTASNVNGRQRWTLWRNANTKHRSGGGPHVRQGVPVRLRLRRPPTARACSASAASRRRSIGRSTPTASRSPSSRRWRSPPRCRSARRSTRCCSTPISSTADRRPERLRAVLARAQERALHREPPRAASCSSASSRRAESRAAFSRSRTTSIAICRRCRIPTSPRTRASCASPAARRLRGRAAGVDRLRQVARPLALSPTTRPIPTTRARSSTSSSRRSAAPDPPARASRGPVASGPGSPRSIRNCPARAVAETTLLHATRTLAADARAREARSRRRPTCRGASRRRFDRELCAPPLRIWRGNPTPQPPPRHVRAREPGARRGAALAGPGRTPTPRRLERIDSPFGSPPSARGGSARTS